MRPYLIGLGLLAAGLSTPALAKNTVVVQSGRMFKPAAITIAAGDSVEFKNEDSVSHNVFSASKGQEFDLKVQRPGTTAKHEFIVPGIVEVRCAIHPQMVAKISVTP